MSSRGTDPAIERRQLRDRSEQSGLDGWLADAFSAGAEVTLLGLPGLVWLMDVEPNAAVKFAALVGWVSLVASLATVRGGWSRLAPGWPRRRPGVLVALFAFHNVVLVAAALGGVRADLVLGTPVASMLVAIAMPVVGVVAVARLAVALGLPPSK